MIHSVKHVLLAVPTAATVGAAVFGLEVGAGILIGGLAYDASAIMILMAFGMSLMAFVFAWPVFMIGLMVVGGPVWWVLHRLVRTSRFTAIVAGAAGSSLTGLVLTADSSSDIWVWTSLGLIVPGGLAGLTVRRVAYRPIKPPPQSPARPS